MDELSLELDREKRQRSDIEQRLERERKINRMQVRQLKKELAEEREKTLAQQKREPRGLGLAERSFSNLSNKSRSKSIKSKGRPVSEHRLLRKPTQKSLSRDNSGAISSRGRSKSTNASRVKLPPAR